MASKPDDPNSVKPDKSKRVRIIAKIRNFTNKESESLPQNSKPWITIKKPQQISSSDKYTIFLDTQSTSRKDGYELDYCYEQGEEMYTREIRPLISEAFDGRNASVIAVGAKGSGKTYTIQGCQEKPGLAVMAMSEILSKANELGKTVSVSLYELTQDNAYDLLNPARPSVQVLEDGQGKINFKGLSQVSVKSISEFHSIYFSQGSSQNTQKIPINQPRNHKGLMVHISSGDEKLTPKIASKINFVDLAGYEDPRRSNSGVTAAESNRTNKSLYALLGVVSAIKANESRIPYRESKLTRILQDSLGGISQVLVLTCLNPSFCQDTLSSISLVSRSYRSTKQVLTDSTNRSQMSAKVKTQSSIKVGTTMSASVSVKKQIGHSQLLAGKKPGCILKGRKLFEEKMAATPKQMKCQSEDISKKSKKILRDMALVVPPLSLEEAPQDKFTAECSPPISPTEDNSQAESQSNLPDSLLPVTSDDKDIIPTTTDISSQSGIYQPEASPSETNPAPDDLLPLEAASTQEENSTLQKRGDASPPLSERIREISNNLKSLCATTPLRIKISDDIVPSCNNQNNIVDPKTPVLDLKTASSFSPCGNFSNSRVKNSLVQDYLHFLNSANKEELKSLKGIGEKRATYILELREESPEPFKDLDDLEYIGLSAKQIKGMMKQVAGDLFN